MGGQREGTFPSGATPHEAPTLMGSRIPFGQDDSLCPFHEGAGLPACVSAVASQHVASQHVASQVRFCTSKILSPFLPQSISQQGPLDGCPLPPATHFLSCGFIFFRSVRVVLETWPSLLFREPAARSCAPVQTGYVGTIVFPSPGEPLSFGNPLILQVHLYVSEPSSISST